MPPPTVVTMTTACTRWPRLMSGVKWGWIIAWSQAKALPEAFGSWFCIAVITGAGRPGEVGEGRVGRTAQAVSRNSRLPADRDEPPSPSPGEIAREVEERRVRGARDRGQDVAGGERRRAAGEICRAGARGEGHRREIGAVLGDV